MIETRLTWFGHVRDKHIDARVRRTDSFEITDFKNHN